MTIDIAALDSLPESDPLALEDLNGLGLRPCPFTCWFWTCYRTCQVTDA